MHLSESCRVRETKAGLGQEEEERRDWALRDVGRSRAADLPGAEPARSKRRGSGCSRPGALPPARGAAPRRAGARQPQRAGRGSGRPAVGGGCPPSPPSTSGGPAGLGAGRAPVSQAGFFLRLWGRRVSAAERVPPSPIRLRRPPARPRFPGARRPASPARLAV